MNIPLVEITADQITGLNRSVIRKTRQSDRNSQEIHAVISMSGLQGCVGGIFQQLNPHGYVHLPLERMAGLLLYRIAQGQFFKCANKRTALIATKAFLWNNSHQLRIDEGEVNDLLWGFASPIDDPSALPKYTVEDSVQFIFDNILPVI